MNQSKADLAKRKKERAKLIKRKEGVGVGKHIGSDAERAHVSGSDAERAHVSGSKILRLRLNA